ncbi:putative ubiquitin-conjugating enzyme E2 39 [Durio zibethinus]|uniref:Ubiquitin-conjugating enzyme E2 39 n=1 Tax=Durio zibethinus TaxID=66656 RepID=A0A6P5Z8S2_DURZI|nr:putative ubiquitin-conjugating enzyme E2 39 [Durio zibethinus]
MAFSVHFESQNGNFQVEETDILNQFDVVSDDSDHFFLNPHPKTKSAPPEHFANASSTVHRAIMQEWRILQKNLPESIFVRVYEKRIDLLRAAIIGAAGTPYHDGLFFFDLAFPPDYPVGPPLVHYRSFGLSINPNLYPDGKVCLSLINTWIGEKFQKWNPKATTVLQLLVSIQALVLNEKPFYNEPIINGILPGKTIKEQLSVAYNRDVFVMSCKTMLFLMRKPPTNFEGLVFGHFRERGSSILLACMNYVNGRVQVGCFKNDGSGTSGTGNFKVPKKFKGSLKRLYPELAAEFSKAGASLGNSIEELNVEEEEQEKKKLAWFKIKQVTEVKVRKARGVTRRLFGKLNKAFGMKLGRNGRSNQNKVGRASLGLEVISTMEYQCQKLNHSLIQQMQTQLISENPNQIQWQMQYSKCFNHPLVQECESS